MLLLSILSEHRCENISLSNLIVFVYYEQCSLVYLSVRLRKVLYPLNAIL